MDDAELASLLAGRADCPYPGTWPDTPFEERSVDGVRYALVAVDPGLSVLGVRRDDGSLWCLAEDGRRDLLNSGVTAFVAFTRAYAEAVTEADAYDGPGDDLDDEAALEAEEEAADAFTERLLVRFRGLDAAAVADENAFWSVAAEELGYGLGG
ncbi:SUKH-4 family immunity protein [Kitasatospora sp. NPDC057692]|uniref:SUKH-4 family immunity protein n=1 Tax=Kitasatospora sp. NPDC057692 TaxID=3346215 RepID=UPI003691B7EA